MFRQIANFEWYGITLLCVNHRIVQNLLTRPETISEVQIWRKFLSMHKSFSQLFNPNHFQPKCISFSISLFLLSISIKPSRQCQCVLESRTLQVHSMDITVCYVLIPDRIHMNYCASLGLYLPNKHGIFGQRLHGFFAGVTSWIDKHHSVVILVCIAMFSSMHN